MGTSHTMELPCKIGETIYMVTTQSDSYDDSLYPVIIQTNFKLEMLKEFGKRYFLKREEAEEALNKVYKTGAFRRSVYLWEDAEKALKKALD